DLIQIGYVVRDIERMMHHWTQRLGIGPWFYIPRLDVPDFTYLGEPSPVELSLALSYSGGVQLELIQQRNDAPSAYRYFYDEYDEGVQHLGFGTVDFEHSLNLARARGYQIQQQGTGGSRGPFAYLSTDWSQKSPEHFGQ